MFFLQSNTSSKSASIRPISFQSQAFQMVIRIFPVQFAILVSKHHPPPNADLERVDHLPTHLSGTLKCFSYFLMHLTGFRED